MDAEQFWANIDKILSKNHISWNELSKRTGISLSNLIKNKRLKTEPRLSTIVKIIKAIDISPNDLIF